MMRFIFALMVVVGTTTAIQSPNLGTSGFVTTTVKFAPGDTTCQTPVAVTYQPTGICIPAQLVNPSINPTTGLTQNIAGFPTVTPFNALVGVANAAPYNGVGVFYQSPYGSYMYSVSQANVVFISYFTDVMCAQPVYNSNGVTAATAIAADTQVSASTTCTLVGSFQSSFSGGGSAGTGGWLYTTTPFTFSTSPPTTLGNVPMSILNTYADSTGMGSTMASCAGLPTSVTMQNVALTQMAPFSSGNTCAKTACMASQVAGYANGASSIALASLPAVKINAQTTCMTPTTSSTTGYYLRNYFLDAACATLDRVDQLATNVCSPFAAGNVAPSTRQLTYTGTASLSGTGGTNFAYGPSFGPLGMTYYPEGLLPTAGSTVMTFQYTSPGSYVNTGNTAVGPWAFVASGTSATNVYVINYATSSCASTSVLMFRPKAYNLVGTSTPTCSALGYSASQSAWTPYTLTYNVYASGSYPPIAAYTVSTNSFNVAFATTAGVTSSGAAPNTFTLTANQNTQVQIFYGSQNDCMAGNTVNIGWAQYTNIANGANVAPTTSCIGTTATTGGAPGRNAATLTMCSIPTVSTVTTSTVNYVLVQKFETPTCTGALGYHYLRLNTCHFTSMPPTGGANSLVSTVMYTLLPQNGLTTAPQLIQQQYFTQAAALTTPTCAIASLVGSSLYGTTGAATAATTTTPLTAIAGACMPSGASYAQFSITAQPTAVAGVSSSYSTASFSTTAGCAASYATNSPTTIGSANGLVQLFVPASTCNQVNVQMSYQSTMAAASAPVAPAAGTPGGMVYNNIFTMDSSPYGNSQLSSISYGQIANAGIPMATPFYSQTSLVGCNNNQAMGANTACFSITSVLTGVSGTGAASTVFLQYLQGAVKSVLAGATPSTTTAGTYADVNLISVVALSTTQTQITYNVQMPSMIYGTAVTATSSNNPFATSATASAAMQTYFNSATSYSNLQGGGGIYSNIAVTSTIVSGTGCVQLSPTMMPTMVPTPTIGSNLVGSNAASNGQATACFAGSEVVTMENGSSKSIAEVQIGDRILSADVQGKTSFSDVVYIPHGANEIEATFVMLTTESGRNVKMTTNHILPAGQCGAAMTVRRADAVSAGDCVMTVDGAEKVMDMVTVQGKGIYTVVTNKEYIVVNGIVATPFGGVNPTIANIYYNLHRLVYAFMPAALVSSNSVVQQVMEKFASLVL